MGKTNCNNRLTARLWDVHRRDIIEDLRANRFEPWALRRAAVQLTAAAVALIQKRNRMYGSQFIQRCTLGALGHLTGEVALELHVAGMGLRRPLKPQEIEVLKLLGCCEPGRWMRPMDVGGRDSSHHSATLTTLASFGLVDAMRFAPVWSGGHKRYRLSDLGRDWLKRLEHT